MTWYPDMSSRQLHLSYAGIPIELLMQSQGLSAIGLFLLPPLTVFCQISVFLLQLSGKLCILSFQPDTLKLSCLLHTQAPYRRFL